MRILTPFLVMAVALYAMPVLAVPSCPASHRVATQNYPGEAAIPTSNNLILPAGKSIEADGQKLILIGTVLDSECKPVQEATVELWQNNPYGRWILAEKADLATPNPAFAGAGRAYTTNDGKFAFITAFPAPLGKRAPFVNIKVGGDGVRGTTTALFFSEDGRNYTDEVYKKLSAKTREDVTITMTQDEKGDLIGNVTIVLEGKAPFRTY